jgi:glycosyltransferase involved in cell wall biosynthesis
VDQPVTHLAEKAIKISVVIPVRNEADSIRALLDGLLSQTLRPAEIVITDGGSTDATREIISEYINNGAPIRLLCEAAALPGRGRNLAAAQATNEWIAFVDAGARPETTWLESLARRVQQKSEVRSQKSEVRSQKSEIRSRKSEVRNQKTTERDTGGEVVEKDSDVFGKEIDVVYGCFEPVTDTLFKRCAVMAYVAPPVLIEGKLVRTRSVASLLMKRSLWETVGGFPEDLRSAEDLLFLNKVEQATARLVHAPDALVHWQVQATPALTFKRFVTYARNNMQAGLWRQWQAAIFIRYGLLVVSALPAIVFGGRWLLVTLLLWLLMLAARAAVAIRRNRFVYPGGIFENALRMLVLVPLIALLDAATITGTLLWAAKSGER